MNVFDDGLDLFCDIKQLEQLSADEMYEIESLKERLAVYLLYSDCFRTFVIIKTV